MKNGLTLSAEQRQMLRQLSSPKSRQLITAMFVLAAVYVLAKSSWSLLPLAVPLPSSLPASTSPSESSSEKSVVDLNAMVAVQWFGQTSADALTQVQQTLQSSLTVAEAEAVESALRVNLLGVVLADDERLSRVIVDQQGTHRQFAVGENLPVGRNVKLIKVLSDRIIIDNGGRYEYIALYESDQSQLGQAAAPIASVQNQQADATPEDVFIDHSGDAQVSTMLAELKQKILSDPAALTQIVTIGAQYQDGELIGYAVAPGSMRKEFAQLGFQTGDIVVAVNGMPLNTPESLPQVMAAMQSGMVDIELLRNGGSVNISVSMDAP